MRGTFRIGLAVALMACALPACGDDDDDTGGNTGGAHVTGGSAGKSSTGGTAGKSSTGGTANATGGSGGKTTGGTVGKAGEGGTVAEAGGGAGGTGEAGSNAGAGAGGVEAGAGGVEAGAGGVGGFGGETAGQGGAGGAEMIVLNDRQIVQLAETANDGEVAEGALALIRAQSTAVKTFAQRMVEEHTAAGTQTRSLATAQSLPPQASSLSQALEVNAQTTIAALNAAPQGQFDLLYIESQVTAHEEVLALFDRELVPQATNEALKTLLATLRASVASHLADARTIRGSL